LGILFWFLYSLSAIIAPFLFSIVVAYILNPIVRLFERIRIPRPYAVLLLYIIAGIACILIVVPLTLTIVSEVHELVLRISKLDVTNLTNEYKSQAKCLIDKYSHSPGIREYLEVSMNNQKIQEWTARGIIIFKDFLIQVINQLFSFFLRAFSSIVGLVFIPLLTFYILVDLDMCYEKVLLLVPPIYRNSFSRIASDIDVVLSGFLRGQIIACLIFGSLMTIGLWLAGLNFFLVIGPVAGIANMVPYLGGLSTIICSILVAFGQFGLTNDFLILLLKIAVTLSIVQAIDGFVLQPKVIGENAGLHPLVVMFAMVIGASLFGIFGMFLAIPVTCILKVLSRELYHELYDQP